MRTKNKRILTWALGALGAAIIILGTVLVLTLPAGAPFADGAFWHGRGQACLTGQAAPAAPGAAAPDGSAVPYGFGRMHGGFGGHGGHGIGGGFLGLAVGLGLILLVLGLVFGRGRFAGHRAAGEAGAVHESAEEILRRSFAEGKLGADEYRSRLDTLRGKGV
jgi:uncharacterized membrane protein